MSTKELILENISRSPWFRKAKAPTRKERKARIIFSALRLMAIAVSAAQMFVFHIANYSVFSPVVLISVVTFYTILESLLPIDWYRKGLPITVLSFFDLGIGAVLILLTGGLYSPFLLFSLSPILRAGLFLEVKITLLTAIILSVSVISSHVFNPFFDIGLSESDFSFFFIFVAAVSLSAVLPYLINVNLRQRLKAQDILEERQRLSHEIHDGFAQTVTALRWQVQLLQRRLANSGIHLVEASELEVLVEKAQHETRESLELLRNYRGEGSLLLYLRDYQKLIEQQTGAEFTMDVDGSQIYLEPSVEIEVLRICQEALTNARKHSGARKVSVTIKSAKGRLNIIVSDDGRGFDVASVCDGDERSKCHGLSVMRERAESIGAKFEISGHPGKGAQIELEVPGYVR